MESSLRQSSKAHQTLTGVLFPGSVVTGVVITLIYFLGELVPKLYVMGWYVYYIIPAGAFIVGGLSGSGYGFFSWIRGIRVGRPLLWVVAALQLVAYVLGQYQEYVHIDPQYEDGTAVPFLVFFDYATQSFAWAGKHGKAPEPVGMWGYGLRILEMAGFIIGGIIPLILLRRRTYCDECQRYNRRKLLGLIPAGVIEPSFKRGSTRVKFEADDVAALQTGNATLEELLKAVSEQNAEIIIGKLTRSSAERRAAAKLTRRISVHLDFCPLCKKGILDCALWEGIGDTAKQSSLEKILIPATLVDALRKSLATK